MSWNILYRVREKIKNLAGNQRKTNIKFCGTLQFIIYYFTLFVIDYQKYYFPFSL